MRVLTYEELELIAGAQTTTAQTVTLSGVDVTPSTPTVTITVSPNPPSC